MLTEVFLYANTILVILCILYIKRLNYELNGNFIKDIIDRDDSESLKREMKRKNIVNSKIHYKKDLSLLCYAITINSRNCINMMIKTSFQLHKGKGIIYALRNNDIETIKLFLKKMKRSEYNIAFSYEFMTLTEDTELFKKYYKILGEYGYDAKIMITEEVFNKITCTNPELVSFCLENDVKMHNKVSKRIKLESMKILLDNGEYKSMLLNNSTARNWFIAIDRVELYEIMPFDLKISKDLEIAASYSHTIFKYILEKDPKRLYDVFNYSCDTLAHMVLKNKKNMRYLFKLDKSLFITKNKKGIRAIDKSSTHKETFDEIKNFFN